MTREEAITMLYGMRADNLNLDDVYTKDKYDALSIAIQTLERVEQIREEFINKYPKNYMGEPELGGHSCVFTLNEILEIIDKAIRSRTNEKILSL